LSGIVCSNAPRNARSDRSRSTSNVPTEICIAAAQDSRSSSSKNRSSIASRYLGRIDSSHYAEALAHLRTLGDVLEVTEHGEDVTAERVDVEARLAAKRALEQRLIALTEHTGSVAELIQVENELGRVRGDIESMEANERSLEGRIAFATIRLDVDAPEQQAVASAESFGSKLRRAFHSGGVAATEVITGTVVLGTAASPIWISLLAVWIGRRMMRRTV